MTRRAYNDPDYRAAVADLRVNDRPCHVCGRPATTVDHRPALALHEHVRGAGCCQLLPACGPHNYGAGRRIAVQAARRRGAGLSVRPNWSRRW